jgi:hypothetical protein
MSEEDKAVLTPADLRRRQGSAIRIVVLFIMVVLAGLAAVVLSVNDARNYRRLIQALGLDQYTLFSLRPANVRIDKQRPLAPAERYPPWLLKATLERQAVFERFDPLPAEERCRRLGEATGAEPEFTNSDKDWECILFKEFGASPSPASFFIQARGQQPDQVRSFRIKLNLTDPQVEPQMLTEAAIALGEFGLPMTPETRTYVVDMLATHREFSSIVENYRMKFAPEMMDPNRYNLLLLPRPQTSECGAEPAPEHTGGVLHELSIACLPLRNPVRPL